MNIVAVGEAQHAPVGCDVSRCHEERSLEPENSGYLRCVRVTPQRDDANRHGSRGQQAAADKDHGIEAGEMLPDVIGDVNEIGRQEGHSCNRQPVARIPSWPMHFNLPR
jgi:hypothetical protein